MFNRFKNTDKPSANILEETMELRYRQAIKNMQEALEPIYTVQSEPGSPASDLLGEFFTLLNGISFEDGVAELFKELRAASKASASVDDKISEFMLETNATLVTNAIFYVITGDEKLLVPSDTIDTMKAMVDSPLSYNADIGIEPGEDPLGYHGNYI